MHIDNFQEYESKLIDTIDRYVFQTVVEQVVMKRAKATSLRDDTLERYIEQKQAADSAQTYGTGAFTHREAPPTPKQLAQTLRSAKRTGPGHVASFEIFYKHMHIALIAYDILDGINTSPC